MAHFSASVDKQRKTTVILQVTFSISYMHKNIPYTMMKEK